MRTGFEKLRTSLLMKISNKNTCFLDLKADNNPDIIMENSASYWKDLYFKVYSENRQLRLELESVQQAYQDIKHKYKSMKPPKSTRAEKKEMKISLSADLAHLEVITHTIIAPGYDVSKLSSQILKNSFAFNTSKKIEIIPDEAETELNPDLFFFEELFILSVSSNFKSVSVVGRYPNATDM